MTEWIKFSDKHPNENQSVIVWCKDLYSPILIIWGGKHKRFTELLIGDVNLLTHWVPLPEIPKD